MTEGLSRERWQTVVVDAARARGIHVVVTPEPHIGWGKTWQYRKLDGSLSRDARFLWLLSANYLRDKYGLCVTPAGDIV